MLTTTFLVVLFATAYLVTALDRGGSPLDGYLFAGTLSGMFALLGVVVGAADGRLSKRLGMTLVGGLGLCGIFLLRSHFNGWELLLSVCRLVVVGAVFVWVRHYHEVVFTDRRPSTHVAWGTLTLKHLFGFTTIVALFLAFVRFLDDYQGPGGDIFLIGMTAVVGAFAALVSILAAMGVIGQQRLTAGIPFALAILMFAACQGVFSYSQTDNVRVGVQWSVNSVVEALTVTAALLAFRYRGYRLASLPPDSR